jgi:probable addiction module antidote protein
MSRKAKAEELPKFDLYQYLDHDHMIAVYLTDILREGDGAVLATALGNLSRARGMAVVAKRSGLTREALYKALRPGSSPRFNTMVKVLGAFNVKLIAVPTRGKP